MLDGNSYTISQEIHIGGKPFHGGGISELIFKPKYSPGIVFVLGGEEFTLDPNIIQATTKHTARFNRAIFQNLAGKKLSFEIIEHRHSAIIQALGFNAGLIIEIPSCDVRKELTKSFVGGSLAFIIRNLLSKHLLPYSGGGIYKPYSLLRQHRDAEIIHTGELLSRNTFANNKTSTTIDEVHIRWDKKGDRIHLQDLRTGAEIIIGESNALETTVLSATHPDVRQLSHIQSEPYYTDYKHNNSELLGARALGRVGRFPQWLGAKILQSTGGYGISEEGYFMAYRSISPEQLIQSMQDVFQEGANEHLAHTTEADFPSELRIPIQILNTNGGNFGGYKLHFQLNNTNHITRVKILRAFVKYMTKNLKY